MIGEDKKIGSDETSDPILYLTLLFSTTRQRECDRSTRKR